MIIIPEAVGYMFLQKLGCISDIAVIAAEFYRYEEISFDILKQISEDYCIEYTNKDGGISWLKKITKKELNDALYEILDDYNKHISTFFL